MKQVKELALGIPIAPNGCALLFQVDGGAAKNSEPHETHRGGNQHDPNEEFADGATAGNTGQEHADERAPGNPPCPVENGPAAEPFAGVCAGRFSGATNHFEEVRQVRPEGFGK